MTQTVAAVVHSGCMQRVNKSTLLAAAAAADMSTMAEQLHP